jgi:hypothetical protein
MGTPELRWLLRLSVFNADIGVIDTTHIRVRLTISLAANTAPFTAHQYATIADMAQTLSGIKAERVCSW